MTETSLRDKLKKALMKEWFEQTFTGSGTIDDRPVTTIRVKDKQVDAILSIIESELGEDEIVIDPYGMVLEDGKIEFAKQVRNEFRAMLKAKLNGGSK